MGYYTRHSLENQPESDEIWAHIAEREEEAAYALGECGEGGESCKWYDHEDDMRRISKLFPEHLFVLSGEGQEARDIWKEYHRNGKMQRASAQITFEPFDESKLR